MKQKLLFLTLLILAASVCFSQTFSTVGVPTGSKVESTSVIDGVVTHSYSNTGKIPINGTPFLSDYFDHGILELHDGQKSGSELMRYNIAKDLFEIVRGNDTLILNRPYAVKYIYLDNKVFVFDPKLRENVDRKFNGYFQLCVDGKLSLFMKRLKKLSFDNFVSNYQGGSGTKEYYYIDNVSFIGKISDGEPFLMKSSKKFIKNLTTHKAEVKAYIKDEKIKFNKEEDLVRLVNYYNSL